MSNTRSGKTEPYSETWQNGDPKLAEYCTAYAHVANGLRSHRSVRFSWILGGTMLIIFVMSSVVKELKNHHQTLEKALEHWRNADAIFPMYYMGRDYVIALEATKNFISSVHAATAGMVNL